VESSSIKMDLHRRDFTINTLALRLDGEHFGQIYDYWGGLSDLHKGQIRVLHALSFVDDATRLLRGVRFEQRFGFEIEPRTLSLMAESLPLLDKLTGARIRHEINLILAEPKASLMLQRLSGLGILKAIHPELPWDETLQANLSLVELTEVDPAWDLPAQLDHLSLIQVLRWQVWLGKLPQSAIQSIASRLRFKSNLKKLLLATSRLIHALPELDQARPSQVAHLCADAPRLAIYAAHQSTQDESIKTLLWNYASQWAAIEPVTTGYDLKAMGLAPSPAFSEILSALRDAWLDGKIHTPEQERALAEKLVTEAKLT
jgi:tRNA nucleotidyltransferase (CCA-adding enzyme)